MSQSTIYFTSNLSGVLLLTITCLLGGCTASSSEINPDEILPDGVRIRHGRKVFQTVCIKCHRPQNIRQYTDREWKEIIAKKLKKDPLLMSKAESRDLIYFLVYGNSGTVGFSPAGMPGGGSFAQTPQ